MDQPVTGKSAGKPWLQRHARIDPPPTPDTHPFAITALADGRKASGPPPQTRGGGGKRNMRILETDRGIAAIGWAVLGIADAVESNPAVALHC